ncbi:MAG: hypothetical protein V4616_06510 [Bacteroidota bacterium]
MSWNKLGLIWSPAADKWWNKRYGQLPVPVYLKDKGVVRVFFGSTNSDNCCSISYVDLDENNLLDIVGQSPEPVLGFGEIGMFDDSGVVPSSALYIDSKLYLYTVGYQRCEKVPYMLFAGLAESEDHGESFKRTFLSPILPRNPFRPTSQGAPTVLFHNGVYKMWHWFSTHWIEVDGKPFLDYSIGYAESPDGLNWTMHDLTCVAADASKGEFAVARPWVIFEEDTFKMWYSIRMEKVMYRMGYAESKDGITWERMDDKAGIDVSAEGWDSEMICYPAVIDVGSERYLFYNGNSNGATGFGVAQWIK